MVGLVSFHYSLLLNLASCHSRLHETLFEEVRESTFGECNP